jgi:hypothetical protein
VLKRSELAMTMALGHRRVGALDRPGVLFCVEQRLRRAMLRKLVPDRSQRARPGGQFDRMLSSGAGVRAIDSGRPTAVTRLAATRPADLRQHRQAGL